jgi:hypothetical protein
METLVTASHVAETSTLGTAGVDNGFDCAQPSTVDSRYKGTG